MTDSALVRADTGKGPWRRRVTSARQSPVLRAAKRRFEDCRPARFRPHKWACSQLTVPLQDWGRTQTYPSQGSRRVRPHK